MPKADSVTLDPSLATVSPRLTVAASAEATATIAASPAACPQVVEVDGKERQRPSVRDPRERVV
ncbi:MAG: hypothetical protein ACRDU0_03165 [Mycobacterium sp.]